MNEQRALLLTDVVDSTQLAERLGDAAAAELGAAHDRMARDLLRTWRGREIDKTDGMLMMFDSAADAAACAVAYHAALAALPVALKARAGLHVGAVILRANLPEDVAQGAKLLEVEGIAKPIAARVMSLAQGGQTLLTAEARAALGETALRVQSHGFWRVKGVAEPVELFEVGDERALFAPPPDSAKVYRVLWHDGLWLPLREVAHGLPAERDAFVGRQRALGDLVQRFEDGARLVSVLGVGGSGKTRLATRFAWTWLGDFPGGAWFCDLSAARGPEGIVQAVAHALNVPLGPDDPVQQLGHAIAGRGVCLVILDNFEQVARHAEDTLGRWLDRAAEARFLVTTREVLGLPGEESMALPPLDAQEANALFMRRAIAARHGFGGRTEDPDAVAELVKLLDGLPLAIELAAARVRVMEPRALLARMDRRFQILAASGGRRDRQATLRATFDWSWELLGEAEKSALAQLSVFEGGFTLEAVESVLDVSHCAGRHWLVDLLQSLVDKSFVRPLEAGRFDLLSSVQDYAAEHLRTIGRFPGSGLAAELGASARHGAYFATSAERPDGLQTGQELDNLTAACRRAVARDDVPVSVAALMSAWSVLQQRGPFRAGCELASAVAQMTGLHGVDCARVAYVLGCAHDACGDLDAARQQLELALTEAGTAADAVLQAKVSNSLGAAHGRQGHLQDGRRCHETALHLARQTGDRSEECAALSGLGNIYIDLGLTRDALDYFAQALSCARAAGDRRWECGVLGNLGVALFNQGSADEAAQHFDEELAIAREIGHRMWEVSALCNLGALYLTKGQFEAASAQSQAALSLAQAIGHLDAECVARCNLGLVYFARDQWSQARDQYVLALALARELNDQRSQGLFMGYLGQAEARLGQFDDARANAIHGERLLRKVDDRFSLGLLMCHRAEIEHLAGNVGAARNAFGVARSLADELSASGESELTHALDRAAALIASARAPESSASQGK